MRQASLMPALAGERRRLRTEVLSQPSSFDVAVTTYDMVSRAALSLALAWCVRRRPTALPTSCIFLNGWNVSETQYSTIS